MTPPPDAGVVPGTNAIVPPTDAGADQIAWAIAAATRELERLNVAHASIAAHLVAARSELLGVLQAVTLLREAVGGGLTGSLKLPFVGTVTIILTPPK